MGFKNKLKGIFRKKDKNIPVEEYLQEVIDGFSSITAKAGVSMSVTLAMKIGSNVHTKGTVNLRGPVSLAAALLGGIEQNHKRLSVEIKKIADINAIKEANND